VLAKVINILVIIIIYTLYFNYGLLSEINMEEFNTNNRLMSTFVKRKITGPRMRYIVALE